MIGAYQHGGKLPAEAVELKLCEEIYHCTPAELDEQDPERIDAHIEIISERERIWRQQRKKQAPKRRR